MDKKEWYADGLRFSCTQCGDCCTGPPGYVWVDETEAKNIADYLNISIAKFHNLYTHKASGRTTLNERPADTGYDCVFLGRSVDGKATCSIYPARPVQCRTWPFWNENMHAKRWNLKITKFCPGINKGAILSKKKILNILEKDKKNDELILKQNINHQK